MSVLEISLRSKALFLIFGSSFVSLVVIFDTNLSMSLSSSGSERYWELLMVSLEISWRTISLFAVLVGKVLAKSYTSPQVIWCAMMEICANLTSAQSIGHY